MTIYVKFNFINTGAQSVRIFFWQPSIVLTRLLLLLFCLENKRDDDDDVIAYIPAVNLRRLFSCSVNKTLSCNSDSGLRLMFPIPTSEVYQT